MVAIIDLIVACEPKEKVVEPISALVTIDSLMWRQRDSAFVVLQQFAASPKADSLDVFNDYYCQLLISELLFKNSYGQSNRKDLLEAVGYFDSLMANRVELKRFGGIEREQIVFLDARAHYINGVGHLELGDAVQACSEYLKALEIMEEHFDDKALAGIRAMFVFYTYNRLLSLFSSQFMMDPAISCGEQALACCQKEPLLYHEIPNTYFFIGVQYDKKKEFAVANDYYEQALAGLSGINSLAYRDAVSMKALCDYQMGLGAEQSLNSIKQMLLVAEGNKERMARFVSIGAIFLEEGAYDSASCYLEPVFENATDTMLKCRIAESMRVIYDSLGYWKKSDEFMRFLVEHKRPEGESNVLVSQLEGLYKAYLSQKQERMAEAVRKKSIGRVICIVVPFALVVVLAILVKNRKRHENDLQAERLASQKEQNALRSDLQQREERLCVLKETMEQQRIETEKMRMTFLNEEICQHILNLLHGKHITTRDPSYQHDDITLKEEDSKRLKEAVEKHYEGFDAVLLGRCSSLRQSDLTLCHLLLMGLTEREIAALRSRTYSGIKKQKDSLREKLGVDEGLTEYVFGMAKGLCDNPMDDILQRSTLKSTLKGTQKRIMEIVVSNPYVTIPQVASQLNLNPRGIAKHFKALQEKGVIRRVGPDKGGHWEVI